MKLLLTGISSAPSRATVLSGAVDKMYFVPCIFFESSMRPPNFNII